MPFALALSPGLIDDLTTTLHLHFTHPQRATDVEIDIIELNHWVVDGVASRLVGKEHLRMKLKGTINDHMFSGKVLGQWPKNPSASALKLQFDIAGMNVEVPLTIARGKEFGFFELTVEVNGKIAGKVATSFRPAAPVFLRSLAKKHPSIVFFAGKPSDSSGSSPAQYFPEAKKYWEDVVDIKGEEISLKQIVKRVEAGPDDGKPWGEIRIVAHGNADQWLIRQESENGEVEGLTEEELAAFSTRIPTSNEYIDSSTIVVMASCSVGRNRKILDQVSGIFGGATVFASNHVVTYMSRDDTSLEILVESFVCRTPERDPSRSALAKALQAVAEASPTMLPVYKTKPLSFWEAVASITSQNDAADEHVVTRQERGRVVYKIYEDDFDRIYIDILDSQSQLPNELPQDALIWEAQKEWMVDGRHKNSTDDLFSQYRWTRWSARIVEPRRSETTSEGGTQVYPAAVEISATCSATRFRFRRRILDKEQPTSGDVVYAQPILNNPFHYGVGTYE